MGKRKKPGSLYSSEGEIQVLRGWETRRFMQSFPWGDDSYYRYLSSAGQCGRRRSQLGSWQFEWVVRFACRRDYRGESHSALARWGTNCGSALLISCFTWRRNWLVVPISENCYPQTMRGKSAYGDQRRPLYPVASSRTSHASNFSWMTRSYDLWQPDQTLHAIGWPSIEIRDRNSSCGHELVSESPSSTIHAKAFEVLMRGS